LRDDVFVTDNQPPIAADPIGDADRVTAIARLRDLFAAGELSYDDFSRALDQALAASTHAELESAFARLPLPVRLSPMSRRLTSPVVVEARMSSLDLGTGFQLGADTSIVATTGSVYLDLTAASWDAREIDLRLKTKTGTIDVIVPRGVAVQPVLLKGQIVLDDLEPPIPGAPVLRVEATARMGVIRLTHDPQSHSTRRKRHR